MPALSLKTDSTRPKVLITGTSGFIGQWVLQTVLDRGYDARVVVRSEAKAKGLKDFLSPNYQTQLDFAFIRDFSKVRNAFQIDDVAHRRPHSLGGSF